jgi:arylsulfatase A-like enzyme
MYKYISLSLLCSTAITAQTKKPNILFILTDQQSSTMMSCAGNDKLSTPAMDKIAANGVRFTKAYSANPVSLPSRFALFTGHFASEVGVRYNDAIANKDSVAGICARGTLGKVFRDAGYQTLYGGKIHLPWANTKSLQVRMSETYGFSNYFTSNERGELANQTAQFLSDYKATDKPFCMVVSLINPHDICFFWDNKMYDETRPASIPEDSWFYVKDLINKKNEMSEETYLAQLPPFPVNHAQMTNAPALDTYQKFIDRTKLDFYSWSYHRLTEVVDSEIDIILKTLENSVAKENTIIVFTSDHGDMNGSHQLVMKSRIYDEASKIPFIFSGPGIKKNVIDSETIVNNGLDMIPTLCDLAGIARPPGLIGESLKSQLKDTNPVPLNRQYMFFETAIAYVCMDNQYKYALYDGKGTTEVLLDMINDPKETKNIAQLSQYKIVRDRMNKTLTDYMKSRNLVLNPEVTKMPKGADTGTTSIKNPQLQRKVYVNYGKITISDIETKISVSAYNLNGMMLWRATTQDRTFISPSMSKGIYFLYIEENRKQVGQVILID